MSVVMLKAANQLDPLTDTNYGLHSAIDPYLQLHFHDYYEITVITNGPVVHHINRTEQILPSNSIVFIRPQDVHYFQGSSTDHHEYFNLAFSRNTLRSLLSYLDLGIDMTAFDSAPMPPVLHVNPADIVALKARTEKLLLFSESEFEKRKTHFRLLLTELFFLYFENVNETQNLEPIWLDELVTRMKEPENFSMGLHRMTALSGKSMAYISRTFQKHMGVTPTAFLNDVRLNYCANRLAHSKTPIIDIAMEAGFNNLSHFYHLFKEKYSISPREYRKGNHAAYK